MSLKITAVFAEIVEEAKQFARIGEAKFGSGMAAECGDSEQVLAARLLGAIFGSNMSDKWLH